MPDRIRVEITTNHGSLSRTFAAEAPRGDDAVEAALSTYDRLTEMEDDERDS